MLHIARVIRHGSLNAGTLVWQVFHRFYVGAPRATTSYKACINVLLSSKNLHMRLMKSMADVHGNILTLSLLAALTGVQEKYARITMCWKTISS